MSAIRWRFADPARVQDLAGSTALASRSPDRGLGRQPTGHHQTQSRHRGIAFRSPTSSSSTPGKPDATMSDGWQRFYLADFITPQSMAEQAIAAGGSLRWNASTPVGTRLDSDLQLRHQSTGHRPWRTWLPCVQCGRAAARARYSGQHRAVLGPELQRGPRERQQRWSVALWRQPAGCDQRPELVTQPERRGRHRRRRVDGP